MKKSDHTRTAACHLAVERLLAGLKEPARQRRTLELAIDHMQICSYCQSNLEYLVQALMAREEDRLTCRERQELLPEYLQAELEGRAREERWRPIALHLEACSQCAAVYAALHDLAALAERRRGTEPSHYPTPDLSFLEAGRATSPALPRIPWRLEAGRLIIEFTAELVCALQSPVRRAAYASAGLKSARSRRILYRFSLKEAVENLEVTVTAEERRDDPARCTVIVEVDVPSKGGWPNLAGTRVMLRRGQEELETQWTDAFGEAVFEGIYTDDSPNLVFEITPPGTERSIAEPPNN